MTALLSANVSVCSAARNPSMLRAMQRRCSSFSPAARPPDGRPTLLRNSSRPASLVARPHRRCQPAAAGGEQSGGQLAGEAGPASDEPPQLGSLVRALAQPLPRSLLVSLGAFLSLWRWVRAPAVEAAILAFLLFFLQQMPAEVRRSGARADQSLLQSLLSTRSPAAAMTEQHVEYVTLLGSCAEAACFVAAACLLLWAAPAAVPRLLVAPAGLQACLALAHRVALAFLSAILSLTVIGLCKAWQARRLFFAAAQKRREAHAARLAAARRDGS